MDFQYTPYMSSAMDDESNILGIMGENYRQGVTLQQQFWNEADIDTRFRAGDQTLWNQIYGQLPLVSRRTFMFNRIRRIVNMIVGRQRQQRKSTVVQGQLPGSEETASDLSQVLIWANSQAKALETLSDAFEGAVVTGINLLSVYMDYNSDPISGDIKVQNLGYNSFLIDPTFKQKDLSDCNYIWTRKWLTKRQVKQLLSGHEKEIDEMNYTANRDDKFIFLPENFQYGIRNLLPYDEYWYLSTRTATMLVDVESGETLEWPGDEEALRDYMQMYPGVKQYKQEIPTVKLAITVNGRLMYNGKNPFNIDRYPFVAVFCYFEPYIPYYPWKIQGVVRGLRDAQVIYNRRKVIELDILESQINSGMKYKEGALVDPNDAFLSGQGRQLAIRQGFTMEDVQIFPSPSIPESTFIVSERMGSEMMEISCVNEELLGVADGQDVTGVLAQVRQAAGLTTLQTLFDQLDGSQKQLGDLFLELIIKNFIPGKVEKILGKPPQEEFYNKAFQKYACCVEEGMLTTSQRQMQFAQLLQLQELGIDVPPDILVEATTLQRKEQLIASLQAQKQQQAQEDQRQFEAQMREQEIVARSLGAKAESDEALAKERLNKVMLDAALSAERIQRAQEESSKADLDTVRAIKELDELDINNARNLIDMLDYIKDRREEPKQEIESERLPKQRRNVGNRKKNG